MRGRTHGLGIIEVLIALSLLGILMAFAVPSLIGSITGDAASRVRGQALAATEVWLDRYRSGQEPVLIGAPCTSGVRAFSCTYAAGRNYGADSVPSHVSDAAKLNAQMAPFSFVISGALIQSGASGQLWSVRVQTTARDKTVEASTYVAR